MRRLRTALVIAIVAAPLVALSVHAGGKSRSILLTCTGMELTQSPDPDNAAPDANSGQQPDDGSPGNSQAPGDDDATGDGEDADPGSTPDTAQPPGCHFQNGPLELIV